MKRILCTVLALTLVLALLAGCGGGSTPTQAPATEAPATQAPATQAPATEAPPEPEDDGGWDFSDANNVNLTFAMYLPEADETTRIMLRYLDMVKEYTEGTVDYTLYAGQTLCMADESLDAVRNGLADVTFFATSYGAGSLPLTYILEMPGVEFNGDRAASYTFNEWHETLKPAELSDLTLMFACGQLNGGFLTTVPIRTYDDFKGKIIRCPGSYATVLELYGINPTVMPISEVYEALRTGVVQGNTGMVPAGYSFKLHEVTQYCTVDPFYVSGYVFVMNTDVWNSLTPDQQAAVEAATDDAFEEFISYGRQSDFDIAIAAFEEAGLEIINLPEEDLAKMAEVTGEKQIEYAASVDGGTEALELLRELAAKYNAMY